MNHLIRVNKMLALHATLARFLVATVLTCCGLLRAITGVYNVMFRTSLPARASFTETAVLLVRALGSSCWFGPAMDIDTHIGATLRADTFSICVPTYHLRLLSMAQPYSLFLIN